MTQIFAENGTVVPVTVIEAAPGVVVEVKTNEKHGYEAVKVGFIEVAKETRLNKPMAGLFKKAGVKPAKVLKELAMGNLKVGDKVTLEGFTKGDTVSVTGISKGKGFQGPMKRHNFRGGPDSHGGMGNRAPGSIGASTFPSRVLRGKRMAGHMGCDTVTAKNLKVAEVRPDQNLILVRGAVPGGKNGIVEIRKEG